MVSGALASLGFKVSPKPKTQRAATMGIGVLQGLGGRVTLKLAETQMVSLHKEFASSVVFYGPGTREGSENFLNPKTLNPNPHGLDHHIARNLAGFDLKVA